MKTNKYILLLAAFLLLAACTSEKNIHKTLPEGNYNLIYPESKMNDSLNQISLVAIPDVFGNSAVSYDREVENSENRSRKLINSKDFIESIIEPNDENKEVIEALTKNLEQVTLITDSSGYVSFSHPITETFAKHKELNISGNVGGTDIFEFNKVKGKYQFEALPEPINSIFWDSHPCIVRDTIRNNRIISLLVWASDRTSPFVRNQNGNLSTSSATDINLYYCFLDNNRILKFDTLTKINSKADEISPFVYCLCSKPKLLFASNRTSETNFDKKDNFDLYYSEIRVNFRELKLEIQHLPKLLSEFENSLDDVTSINTSIFDEVFPYIPNPISIGSGREYIYFSSDRFNMPWSRKRHSFSNARDERQCPCETSVSDSLIQNEGGYDFYFFEVPQTIKCIPPPKPVLYISANVNLISLTAGNDTIDIENLRQQDITITKISKNIASEFQELTVRKSIIENSLRKLDSDDKKNKLAIKEYSEELNSINQKKLDILEKIPASNILYAKSDEYYKADENSAYLFSFEKKSDDCEQINSGEVVLITPENIYKDEMLSVTLNCLSKPKIPKQIKFEYSTGLAFFVTGYWWPTTNENISILKKRINNGCLENSRFIDLNDYDYASVAELNSNFLNNEFYPKIDSVLNLLNKCYQNQILRIVIYGLTDPCRLRATPNEEQTLYTCDSDIVYYENSSDKKTIIKQGTMMKQPNLIDEAGKPFPMAYGVQQGNYLLSMLRSYYTMETIDEGLKKYSEAYRDLRNTKEIYDVFELKAIGIDSINSICPVVLRNFVTNEKFKNAPLVPEGCDNQPFSRRVMIYADVINTEDIKNGFTVSPCGDRFKKSRIKQEEEIPLPPVPVEVVDLDIQFKESEEDNEMGCPGPPCYFWIEFAAVESEEEARFVENVLQLVGIDDYFIDRSRKTFIRIVSHKDEDKTLVEKKLLEYQELLKNKLNPLLDNIILKMSIKF